jgi:nucleoside-diphosphate-sugar epimerase
MEPPPPGRLLDHRCPASDYLPYARSKAIGERMVLEGSDRLPSTVLRIGAAFSDWCELPPLHSLIVNWWGRSALRRVMVGCGDTGMPYVHLDDLVQLVRCCVDSVAGRADCEVFMAAQHGAVCHREMFEIVRGAWRAAHPSTPAAERPIRVSPGLAGIGLRLKRVLGALVGDPPFEQPWMLRYVDRPWAVDTSHTEARLDWRCTPGMGVCDRLPVMLDHLLREPQVWVRRNRARRPGCYEFSDGLG